VRNVLEAWDRFWFSPMSTATLALLRIVVGVLTLGWTLSLSRDLLTFEASDGIIPHQPPYGDIAGPWHTWGLLGFVGGKGMIIALFVVMIVASIALTVGFGTRVAALLVFLGLLSLQRRNPFVFNSGDALLRDLAFYLMLAPSGAAFSVDRWLRTKERFWDAPARAPWALRLIQVQFTILYLAAVHGKVRGATWNDGTAVSYALRIGDYVRLPVPLFISDSLFISNVFTIGTVLLELALAILVWNRALRPWVLLLGVSLHLGIEYSLRVGFYSLTILAIYLAFVPPERVSAWLLALRERLRRSRIAPLRRLAAPAESAGA
jgi:vitamin K-dependent gamma-carboxylase-like protein